MLVSWMEIFLDDGFLLCAHRDKVQTKNSPQHLAKNYLIIVTEEFFFLEEIDMCQVHVLLSFYDETKYVFPLAKKIL